MFIFLYSRYHEPLSSLDILSLQQRVTDPIIVLVRVFLTASEFQHFSDSPLYTIFTFSVGAPIFLVVLQYFLIDYGLVVYVNISVKLVSIFAVS